MKRVLVVLTVLCALFGCQHKEDPKVLSRERAATLIKQSSAFQKTVDIKFELQPNNPQILVARFFGYLDPDKPVLTEKGKQLWRDLNLQVVDYAVPVAHAQLNEVSGISTSGNAADAKFSWQWIPNEIGKALVIDSDEFKALPGDIQTKIRQSPPAATPAFALPNSGVNFGGIRAGTSNFQLYDDGWRLKNVYLF
jgi:hypothetical protein